MTRPLNINLNVGSRYNRVIRSGDDSPRVNGLLKLRPNRFSYEKHTGECFKASLDVYPLDSMKPGFVRWNYGVPLKSATYWLNETGWHTAQPQIDPEENLALKLRNKITETNFNALVTGVEMKSTVVGLAERAQRLANAYRNLRHGDLRGFCRSLDVSPRGPIPPSKKVRNNASGHLLEYQFGIVPIYEDMYNGAVQIYEASNRQHAKVVRVSSKDEAHGSYGPINRPVYPDTEFGGTWGPGKMAQLFYDCDSELIRRMYTTVRVDNPALAHINEFGFTNPLLAVYSVLPSSWIFDAFVPVGSFLQQLYMPPGLSFHDTYSVSVRKDKYFSKPHYREEIHESGYIACDANNYCPVHRYRQVCRVYTHSSCSERVKVDISPHPFPGIQFDLTPKLPFLGQAITMIAFADQQATRLRDLVRRGA